MNETVAGLNDACFVETSAALQGISSTFEEEVGRKPTVEEMEELLLWSLKSCGFEIFYDANCQLTEAVKFKVRKSKKAKLNPGDLFAIPRPQGGFYLSVFLAKNGSFGEAYGFFKEILPRPILPDTSKLKPLGEPVYSGRRAVLEGKWIFIANSQEAAAFFDPNVPIYHAKSSHKHNEKIGEFGAAEYIDGSLRQLDESEAKQIGLLDRSYRVCIWEEHLPEFLEKRLKEDKQ